MKNYKSEKKSSAILFSLNFGGCGASYGNNFFFNKIGKYKKYNFKNCNA